ncbi:MULTISPECIES: aminodeoxychorismate/anthranilate synthase component II [unclassified Staphylococcus]|uniref:anthranilate synthase component II n=1 Tax=unclassified Staphylococcus TaxID=91994 RepID=UPI0021CFE2C2|nr:MULTISPECIES: aminodeoxychorismate/anthranilate synthase component II [unclassified Staphylococcus]UXR69961.1 aminodeoxychorismate/anthranilate synthase component II [Staphylococcus sp. IVB6246]UXR72003.1 aminodeoxychorismate/anthranilate synthase component II [Staphylococcus sp. IVB6240]UXR74310.1 aminodeoxychorismate/anthranilate synthase component II [Staphylococcus sp. IVB6238]UXR76696.1 aminodeoxychorismate/anthranilate synthase component II [Staphylococcus sp. IVB6233]UXR80825.1 amino
MILMIDNKDSFTYNIVDYLKTESTHRVEVIDVDEVTLERLEAYQPEAIVISPGPGAPEDYPILQDVLRHFETRMPILGVCLGFQLIVTYYGGKIVHAPFPVHGHTTEITHDGSQLFKGLPASFHVMRYHSLMADPSTTQSPLIVTATNKEQMIMAVAHETLPIYAVQYHPESILSEHGHAQIRNFLNKVGSSNGCEV